MLSGWFSPLASTYPLVPRTESKFLISLGFLTPWSSPELSHGTVWLLTLAFPPRFRPNGPFASSPLELGSFFSYLPTTLVQSHMTFFHILQPHLPLVASPTAGCLGRDSFLPLLLDIQTGGQRAWTEIAWGREPPRGLTDKQPERDWGGGMPALLCSVTIYTQWIYVGLGVTRNVTHCVH